MYTKDFKKHCKKKYGKNITKNNGIKDTKEDINLRLHFLINEKDFLIIEELFFDLFLLIYEEE